MHLRRAVRNSNRNKYTRVGNKIKSSAHREFGQLHILQEIRKPQRDHAKRSFKLKVVEKLGLLLKLIREETVGDFFGKWRGVLLRCT